MNYVLFPLFRSAFISQSSPSLQMSPTLSYPASVPLLITRTQTNTVWLIQIPLHTRKSNSVTTCWGVRAGGVNPWGDGQSDTVESWFVNVCACEWMTDRKSLQLMVKNGLYKSFPFHLCAGSNPKVIKHSSVVTTDISAAPGPPRYPTQPSHSPLDKADTSLPSYHYPIVPGQEPLWQITGC